ncbi:MAG TPA: hypothetical protein VN867_09535, partial [Candidatus Binataceae bacterium]|nr:hypothetical protein [Candidatus Binataceae bacterium]
IASVALFKPNDQQDHEHIEIDLDSRIQRLRLIKTRKPFAFSDYPLELKGIDEAALDWFMYPGVLVLEPAIFDRIPKTPPWALFSGLLGPMVANRLPVFGYVHAGYFRTVDDLKAYELLRRDFEIAPPSFQHLAL